MKWQVHWQFGLWNTALIILAFLVFGFEIRTVLFALAACIMTSVLVYRLRNRFAEPLRRLSRSIDVAAEEDNLLPVIASLSPEIRELFRTIEGWSGRLRTRVRALRDARGRLESILRSMGEGVLVFDTGGRVILANEAIESRFHVSRNPAGKTCLEVFRNELLDAAIGCVLGGEPADAVEFENASGQAVRASVSPVESEDGTRIEAAVMVLQDLTDVREIDRVRRDFVANVSHEFKTPLTSIRGYVETMREKSAGTPNDEFLDIVHRNARHLESLVNDLLALARIEAEPPALSERVDLRSIVTEQVNLREKLPASAACKIGVDCPPIEVRADPGRLSIALSNLIDNAIRYNRPSGEIRVSCRREGPHAVLQVEDDGFGIPKEELPRLFERFYRVDKARTRNGGGTGLGLAIARHAVEGQGGTLTAESQVGRGSTFTIRLPAGTAKVASDGVPDNVSSSS